MATVSGYWLGFDFGTSGARYALIDNSGKLIRDGGLKWDARLQHDSAQSWVAAARQLLLELSNAERAQLQAITTCGTSGTALIVNRHTNEVVRSPLMYNYNIMSSQSAEAEVVTQRIKERGDLRNPACTPMSSLSKLLYWHKCCPLEPDTVLLHQADYIARSWCDLAVDCSVYSEWHNALKLGFDSVLLQYPSWLILLLQDMGINHSAALPKVVQPGSRVGQIAAHLTEEFGVNPQCTIRAGTTDSIAAFIAAGAHMPGQAATSLGSTLSVKVLSTVPVSDAKSGVYSHRWDATSWLVGGASNVGCAILRQEGYTNDELQMLSAVMDPQVDSCYQYYPLCRPGERFPVFDTNKQPVLDPKPLRGGGSGEVDRAEYLRGLLQGIAAVERDAYNVLESLGATPVTEVLTCGGGSMNLQWTAMRARMLGRPIRTAINRDAAYGAAVLGLRYDSVSGV